ncbi:MAG: insulinase family protein [bacterium]|nr:insulinase family protein [bacterium]
MRDTRSSVFTGFAPPAGLALVALLAPLALTPPVAAQVQDYRDIEYPELQAFDIPRPETFELANGLKVFLLEDDELPLIRVVARIRTGSVYEPKDKTGLAGLMGAVQRTGGTRDMTGDEIDDFLEARAASVETNVAATVGFASMDCLSGDFDEVLPVFHDVLRYPVFDQDKLEIAKAQTRAQIARRNDNVLAITPREFSRLVYGSEAPMSRLTEYATVAAVDRGGLSEWHGRFYHPNNVYLGVVGDFDSAGMKQKLQDTFGDWPEGPPFDELEIPYRKDQEAGVYFIEKSDVTQANVRLGHLGITVDDPDFFSLQVMNEVLSGGFSGRLLRNIRTEKGLAYSAGGSVGSSFAYPGVTGFGLQTKSETMGEAVDALYEELEGMISNPATEEELARAKDTILNSFIFNYASKGQVLEQQMLYDYYGLPVDFLETYRSNIEKVSVADVARVAEAHLHPDKATLLVVGRAEDFDRPLSSFGEVSDIDISIPSPPDRTAAVEVTEDDMTAGREVFSRMVSALGGENSAALEALRTSTSLNVTMQGQQMTLAQTFLVVFPDRLYLTIQTPVGMQEVVVTGGEGFVRMGGRSQPLPAEQVERQVRELGRELFSLLRNHRSEDLEVALVGSEEIEGHEVQTVLVSSPTFATRLWIDSEGRLVKQMYQGTHPATGAPGEYEVVFSDYRSVGEYTLPHKRVTKIDGDEFATATVESFEINPPVDMMVFEKPAA